MEEQKLAAALKVGERVLIDAEKATVRYIGSVPSTKGIWIGVEWDDPSRGKYDGSEYGLNISSNPKGGSFVRPRKVHRGQCLCKAIKDRYGEPVESLTEEELGIGIGAGHKTIEMVGFEKVNKVQSQLQLLQKVSIHDSNVSRADDDTCLAALCPRVDELELTCNLLSEWSVVARYCKQLPRLTSLNISENRMQVVDAEEARALSDSFSSLKTIYLIRMNYDWSQILACVRLWPALTQLHICYNRITEIRNVPNVSLDNISLLNLEGNKLGSWHELLKVGVLPNLVTLIVNLCGLPTIETPDCEHGEKSKYFPKLKELSISNNMIDSWESISELDKLASLKELRFLSNPILRDITPESARQQCITRIASLAVVNRTKVDDVERHGAEIDYLKMYGQDWRQAGGNQDSQLSRPNNEFLQKHPRYEILVKRWGAPEDSEMKKEAVVLKDTLLELNIKGQTGKEVKKKLPATMTVERLRSLLTRLFRADPTTLKVTCTSTKNPDGPVIELDNDMRLLTFYSIESQDTLVVTW